MRTTIKTALQATAAGTFLGGALLAAGAGVAAAQPLETPEGLLNVTVGNTTILEGVNTETAATASAALCGAPVADLTAKAEKVVSDGAEQTACEGLPGGTLTFTTASNTAVEPGGVAHTPGVAGAETHTGTDAQLPVTLPGATG
jgi:hypothetical protein